MLSTLLLISVGIIAVQSSPGYFVLSPNIFHVGVKELVSISVYGVNQPVTVRLYLQDFPHRRKTFSNTQGVFSQDKPGNLTVKVNPEDLPNQHSDGKQYVYLVAKSESAHLRFQKETKVLLSYKNGLVLIQTDKPIYTPKQIVQMRIIPLGIDLKPSKNNVTVVVKNPQGIQVEKWPIDMSNNTGFISRELPLGDFVLLGNWTIEAWFGHQFLHNTSAQFEVREYVLPKFSVKITAPHYILQDQKKIRYTISAKYTYGKPVIGTLSLRLSVIQFNKKTVPFSTFRTILENGHRELAVRTQTIKDFPGILWFPENGRLLIEAEVLEKATGWKEKAIDNSVIFTSTPYRIKFKNTAKFFKPALPFVIRVEVTYPNKRLAAKIPMMITVHDVTNGGKVKLNERASNNQGNKDQTSNRGEAEFVVDIPRDSKKIDIKVETDRNDIPKNQNAEAQYQALSYYSPSSSFVMIRCNKAQVGRSVRCEAFVSNNQVDRLNYMVTARGQILNQGTIVRKIGLLTTIPIQVTAMMSPSARMIVYCVLGDGEIVVDSTLLDVKDVFPNDVKVKIINERSKVVDEAIPSENVRLHLKARPGSRIGVLIVDQSVYLLRNDNKLTQKQVFGTVESLDLGCGVGGGQDNKDVFMEAGVSVISQSLVSNERSGFDCSGHGGRRRRSVGQNLTSCCDKGREQSHLNCFVRAFSMDDTPQCKLELFKCCYRKAFGEKGMLSLARSGFHDDDIAEYHDEKHQEMTQNRHDFAETWLFEEITAGEDGQAFLSATVPPTITTWVVQALGVSNTTGFGLSNPFNLRGFKNIFVDLKLPYSAQRGEQISVLVTVFNYEDSETWGKLYLMGDESFCSPASPQKRKRLTTLRVKGQNYQTFSFPVVPIEIGTIPIVVKFISDLGRDGVEKQLLVEPEGVERRRTQSFVLDPQGALKDIKQPKENDAQKQPPTPFKLERKLGNNKQTDEILLDVPKNAVPGSVGAMIYLTGNLLGPVVTDLINGGSLHSRLRIPTGCGEQTMLSLGPNVYVFQYLTNTKQVTAQIEQNAYRYIQSGYNRELGYRRNDKSFSAFGNDRPGSTWLTAFVMRVFCAAQKFSGVEIDPRVVCESVDWLVHHQRADGAFPEQNWVIHREMIGGVQGDVGMTAFVLTSLIECQCSNLDTSSAVTNAVTYLENQLVNISTPYILSMVAYTLSLASSPRRYDANQKLATLAIFNQVRKTRHWNAGGRALNIETAGYALLTQVTLARQKYAGPIVSWLTEQRNTVGGFHSTQDTCVALQALAKYSEKTAGRSLNLKVTLTAARKATWKPTYLLTKQNALLQIKQDITHILGGELYVDSEGTGIAQIQVEVRHNVKTTGDEVCNFELKVNTAEERKGHVIQPLKDKGKPKLNCNKYKCKKLKREKKNKCKKLKKECRRKNEERRKQQRASKDEPIDAIRVSVCTRYKGSNNTGMSILDVGILTGFQVDPNEIKLLENVSFVDRVEPSDRSVFLYLSEIPHAREVCIQFKMKREFEVGIVQQVPVKVYDYYEPDESCTKFYSPNSGSPLKLGICKDSQCKCTQDRCTDCDPALSSSISLVKDACRNYSFAFKGKVELIEDDKWTIHVNVRVTVLDIQMEGQIRLKKGQNVDFQKQAKCRCPDLKTKHDYLFMGRDRGGQFVLDNTAYVKMWSAGGKILNEFHKQMTTYNGCI